MTDLSHLFAPLEGVELDNLEVYAVGGAIRDTLLGLSPKDVDFVAVGTTPEILLNLGFRQVGKDFPVFLHPKSHAELALARTERKCKKDTPGSLCMPTPLLLSRLIFDEEISPLMRWRCLVMAF